MNNNGYHNSVVEALILASPEPLPGRKIADLLEDITPGKVGQAVAELNNRYMETGSAFRIREIAGGYQYYIVPEYTGFVDEMFTRRRKMRLTRAALETLAIVAYRQPVTKSDIEHIRGVASDGVIHNLLEKQMVAIKGRANTIGKPLQYGTTDEFLKFFGMNSLEDMPKMSEIEELLKSSEPDTHDQLSFEANIMDTETAQKLNVADGTFDPASRARDEDDLDEEDPSEPRADAEEDLEDDRLLGEAPLDAEDGEGGGEYEYDNVGERTK